MIDVAAVVRTRMLAVSAVTTLINQRVWVQTFPPNPTLPAARVQRVDEQQDMHMRGAVNARRARIQVDSVALTRAAAMALDEAIYGNGAGAGLCGFQGVVGSLTITGILLADVREDYDADELKQFRIIRDYFVHWKS